MIVNMKKPLFRWTVGNCLPQGLEVLAESFKKTTQSLGVNQFDWVVCWNGLSQENLDFLKKAAEGIPILFFEQNWSLCPIEDFAQSPMREDGTLEWHGARCGIGPSVSGSLSPRPRTVPRGFSVVP